MPVRQLLRSNLFNIAALLLFAFAPLCAQDSVNAPGTFRAGAKSFAIPAPTPDLVETGPDYRVLLETFAPTTNRLVAAYVLPDDLTLIRTGKIKTLSVYAMVEVPRTAEFTDVSVENFKTVTDAMGQKFNAGMGSEMKEQEEELNRRLKQLSAKDTITFDKPIVLGAMFSSPEASGFGTIMPISANGITLKMVAGVMALRVNNRVMFGYLYRTYQDEETVKWMRKTLQDWANAILKANK